MSRRAPRPRSAPRRARRGFTLVELMVGIMIMTIGILALAGTSGVLVKQMSEAKQMNVAASVAQTRLERLRGASCTATVSSSATTRGITETWSVTPGTRSAQLIVTVTYPTRRGNRTQTYKSMIPCV